MFSYLLKQANPQPSESKFKLAFSFYEREKKAGAVRKRRPDLIPLIIESSGGVPALEEKKFAIPQSCDIFGLKTFILNSLKKKNKDSILQASTLILMVGSPGYMPSSNEIIKDIYEKYADADGFLYITYTIEVAFG